MKLMSSLLLFTLTMTFFTSFGVGAQSLAQEQSDSSFDQLAEQARCEEARTNLRRQMETAIEQLIRYLEQGNKQTRFSLSALGFTETVFNENALNAQFDFMQLVFNFVQKYHQQLPPSALILMNRDFKKAYEKLESVRNFSDYMTEKLSDSSFWEEKLKDRHEPSKYNIGQTYKKTSFMLLAPIFSKEAGTLRTCLMITRKGIDTEKFPVVCIDLDFKNFKNEGSEKNLNHTQRYIYNSKADIGTSPYSWIFAGIDFNDIDVVAKKLKKINCPVTKIFE